MISAIFVEAEGSLFPASTFPPKQDVLPDIFIAKIQFNM